MSAEGLKKAVLESTRREAGQIVAQARAAAEQEDKQAAEQVQRGASDTLEKARNQAAGEREQALAALEREQRLEVLAAKNSLLDRAFAKAAESFRALPMDRLRELYRSELAAIDLREASLRVPRGAKAEFEALAGGRARVEEDHALPAGYIVLGSNFRLDMSLAARLEQIRAEQRSRVAELLFGTGE
jgi:vacuolar-type H+-ATPase subunit E/Vma4